MQWQKEKIKIENNSMVDAQVPIIISASRNTDIPAFYGDWFVLLGRGNPYSGRREKEVNRAAVYCDPGTVSPYNKQHGKYGL